MQDDNSMYHVCASLFIFSSMRIVWYSFLGWLCPSIVRVSFLIQIIQQFEKYFRGRFILHLSDKASTKITTGASFADRIKALFEI